MKRIDEENAELTAIREKLIDEIMPVCDRVRAIFIEQYEGLQERPLFERMWVLRDFNDYAGMSADQWLVLLNDLKDICVNRNVKALAKIKIPFHWLVVYIEHLQDLAKEHIKDKDELKKAITYLSNWQQSTQSLKKLMDKVK